jgi:hypothetical protein
MHYYEMGTIQSVIGITDLLYSDRVRRKQLLGSLAIFAAILRASSRVSWLRIAPDSSE